MANAKLPFSAAAERNKVAIADALASHLNSATKVLEIGSGTGQHAAYMCERFPNLIWQVTERKQHMANLRAAIEQAALNNIQAPAELEVNAAAAQLPEALSESTYSFIFSANTAHIMAFSEVADMFKVVRQVISADGVFALYGPFKLNGQHSSESNREFDLSLKSQRQHMGIRDIIELKSVAQSCGLDLYEDIEMPANNKILLWGNA